MSACEREQTSGVANRRKFPAGFGRLIQDSEADPHGIVISWSPQDRLFPHLSTRGIIAVRPAFDRGAEFDVSSPT